MKDRQKLHILGIDRVMIQSELKYQIVASNSDFWGAGLVWKSVANTAEMSFVEFTFSPSEIHTEDSMIDAVHD
jgi:hypothetical protein